MNRETFIYTSTKSKNKVHLKEKLITLNHTCNFNAAPHSTRTEVNFPR